MNQSEHNIQNTILLAASELGYTLWRNNVGTGWAGSGTTRRSDGAVIVHNARPLNAGLCKGSSDLIGLKPVVITADMIGTTLAQFVALEVKAQHGRVSTHQQMFIDFVRKSGGIARVIRSVEEM